MVIAFWGGGHRPAPHYSREKSEISGMNLLRNTRYHLFQIDTCHILCDTHNTTLHNMQHLGVDLLTVQYKFDVKKGF